MKNKVIELIEIHNINKETFEYAKQIRLYLANLQNFDILKIFIGNDCFTDNSRKKECLELCEALEAMPYIYLFISHNSDWAIEHRYEYPCPLGINPYNEKLGKNITYKSITFIDGQYRLDAFPKTENFVTFEHLKNIKTWDFTTFTIKAKNVDSAATYLSDMNKQLKLYNKEHNDTLSVSYSFSGRADSLDPDYVFTIIHVACDDKGCAVWYERV